MDEPEFDEPVQALAPPAEVEPQAWDGTWPEPEIRAQLADEALMPATCRGMAKLARLHGWRVRVTYSRGTIPLGGRTKATRWAPGKVVDAYLLRAIRGNTLVCVSWEDGSARTSWFVVPGDWPHAINVTTARVILSMPRPADP